MLPLEPREVELAYLGEIGDDVMAKGGLGGSQSSCNERHSREEGEQPHRNACRGGGVRGAPVKGERAGSLLCCMGVGCRSGTKISNPEEAESSPVGGV